MYKTLIKCTQLLNLDQIESVEVIRRHGLLVQMHSTPWKYVFLPCGHLDFESAVTAQNDEFRAVLIARIHARQTSKLKFKNAYIQVHRNVNI